MIYLMCGLIGAGKSTAAKYIAQQSGGTVVRSDEIRAQLYPEPTFSDEETREITKIFLSQVRELLDNGGTVILDATFYLQSQRDMIYTLGNEYDIPVQVVEVICSDESVFQERIEQRDEGVSKTSYQAHLQHKAKFEPVTRDKIVIDNATTLEDLYAEIDDKLLT